MNSRRFRGIVLRYTGLRAAVVGDIALDRYLHIDPGLAETSIETGLPVRNVVAVRPQAGAGGNVLANLAALRPAALAAVGFCGDDAEGFELRRAMAAIGVDLRHFLARPDRMTFTYTKPLLMHPGRPPEELSRLDFRSRTPTPAGLEDEIIAHLASAAAEADVVIAMDQVPEPASGVLTPRVKAALADLARAQPQKVFIADSRTCIGDFRGVRIKTNAAELARHFGASEEGADLAVLAARLSRELGQDVFVTLAAQGILVAPAGEERARGLAPAAPSGTMHVPGIPLEPPLDVTGAGDAVLAHIAMALAAGAAPAEAAELGNLAGAVVVRKLGTTGTATVEELMTLLHV